LTGFIEADSTGCAEWHASGLERDPVLRIVSKILDTSTTGKIMLCRVAILLLPIALLGGSALAQNASGKVAPTIPETQIEPAELSSPFQFLSAATSTDEFVVQAAALAATRAESADVKALAQQLSPAHTALMTASRAAGMSEKVEVAAPAPDGEQKGLLGKLEALKGAEFDKAYVESQLFTYQRTIAYYRGYSDNGDALAAFAKQSVPQLVNNYASLLGLAEKVGLGSAAQKPAPQ